MYIISIICWRSPTCRDFILQTPSLSFAPGLRYEPPFSSRWSTSADSLQNSPVGPQQFFVGFENAYDCALEVKSSEQSNCVIQLNAFWRTTYCLSPSKRSIRTPSLEVAPTTSAHQVVKEFWWKATSQGADFFTGDNVIWQQPVGSIAVACSSCAVMPLLRTEWFLWLHTLQQRWRGGTAGRAFDLWSTGFGFKSYSRQQKLRNKLTTLGKLFTPMCLYHLVPAKRQLCSAAGKVTAGLSEGNGSLPPGGWLTVTCRLTACTPGSAPVPTLDNEYGKPLPFYTAAQTLNAF